MATPRSSSTPQVSSDLLEALRMWRRRPALPLVAVCLAIGTTAVGLTDVRWVGFPFLLFSLGFGSTEALWYLRLFRGKDLMPQQIWRLSWTYFWPNAGLALLLVLPILVVLGLNPRLGPLGPLLAACLSCVVVVAQVILALRTRSARDAIADAVALIRSEWPVSVVYVFPVLAVSFAGLFAYRFDALWMVVSTGIVAAVASVCKGALTRLYARARGPISDIGASEGSAAWGMPVAPVTQPDAVASTRDSSPRGASRASPADVVVGLGLSTVFWFAFGSTGSFGFQRATLPPGLIPLWSAAGIGALVLAWIFFAAEPIGRYHLRSSTRSHRGSQFDARRGCVWLLISWPLAIVLFVLWGLST